MSGGAAAQVGFDDQVAKPDGPARTADDQCVLVLPLASIKKPAGFFGNHARHGRCGVERLRRSRALERKRLCFGKLLLARIIGKPDLGRVSRRAANPPDGLGVSFERQRVFA